MSEREWKTTIGAMTTEEELLQNLETAKRRYDAMTPEQKAEHDRLQRESFVRGMMPTGDPRFD